MVIDQFCASVGTQIFVLVSGLKPLQQTRGCVAPLPAEPGQPNWCQPLVQTTMRWRNLAKTQKLVDFVLEDKSDPVFLGNNSSIFQLWIRL